MNENSETLIKTCDITLSLFENKVEIDNFTFLIKQIFSEILTKLDISFKKYFCVQFIFK